MGDFNTTWEHEDGVLVYLASELSLKVYQPDLDISTFNGSHARLDWILVSDPFEFMKVEILDDIVSDHKVVVASLSIRSLVRGNH